MTPWPRKILCSHAWTDTLVQSGALRYLKTVKVWFFDIAFLSAYSKCYCSQTSSPKSRTKLLNYSTHHIWLLLSQHDIPRVMSRSRLALISPQANCICQASPPLRLMDWYFITLIPPVKPTPLSTHPPSPLASYGLDEIQTLCGSILKWPNSVSRRAKWKVVKSFEPLLHYNSSKHIQLGPKFREDIKALLHVTLEDDNSWAPLKLLRKSTIKGPKWRTPHTSYWLLMGWVYQTQPIWQSLYLL